VVRTSGTQTIGGAKTFSNNIVIQGDLTISGTTTTINTETVNIADNIILLNSNFTGSSPTESAGIEVERGTQSNVLFQYKESGVGITGDLAAGWSVGTSRLEATGFYGTFYGDGSNMTGVDADSLTGLSTADLAEDPSATVTSKTMYYTDARAQAAIGAGNGLTKSVGTLNVGAGTGISVAADTVGLATAGVGAGTYGSIDNSTKIDTITVDAYGRVTAVATGETGDIDGVTAGAGLTGGGTSGTPTLNVGAGTGISVAADTVGLAAAGVGAGTYGSIDNATKIDTITVDAYGRVTAVATGATGDIDGVTAGAGLTGGGTSGTPTLNVGAGTGISVADDTVGLAAAGVGAGTYGSTDNSTKIDTITVDAYGRVTAVATGETGDIDGVTAGAGLTGGGTSGTPTLNVGAGSGISVAADSVAVDGTVLRTTTNFGGDVSGAYNAIVIADDSHTHDTRYYTETESDGRYVRSNATNTTAGIRFQSQNVLDSASGSQASLEVFQDDAGEDAFMAFHVGGDYALYFGLDGASNDLAVGGWSMGAVKYKVWHAGNHGIGSGLNADLLDGQHGSYYYPASNPNAYTSHAAAANASITLGAGTGINITPNNVFTTNQSSDETINIDINLNELATSVTDGDGDYFVVVDTAGAGRKLTKGNIALSGFNDNISSTSALANKLVKRNESGYIFSNYINTTDDVSASLGYLVGKNTTDNYHRSYSAATVRTFLGDATTSTNGLMTTTQVTKLNGIAPNATATAAPYYTSAIAVGDNGLTAKNFTAELKTKLDGIAPNATATAAPYYTSAIAVGDNGLTAKNFTAELKTKLDGIAPNATATSAHQSYTPRNIDTSGATVIDVFTSDAIGSVTNITTRTMTLGNFGITGNMILNNLTANTISANYITANTITATQMAANSITATQLAISKPTASTGIYFSTTAIEIRDSNNILRVKIGAL
jgi:hypothetical protein